jgi:hypothetical protein
LQFNGVEMLRIENEPFIPGQSFRVKQTLPMIIIISGTTNKLFH